MYQGEIVNLPISRMPLFPQFVCRSFPVLRIWLAPVTEFIDVLWILVIRVHRSGLFDQFPQPLRILQHRAGPQMVLIKRLVVVIRLEDRASQGLKERAVMDIDI